MNPKIIYPGVEERFFSDESVDRIRARLGLEGKRIIYTIARLDERKGQDMVIKALPFVIKEYPNTVYLIGGLGPRINYLKQLVREMLLEEYVRFLGFIQDSDLLAYHKLGEVFVMPNRILEDGDSEGFGIVFLEANAVGNPVIGGHEGGSVDAIDNEVSGYLVDPRNERDIAEKICMFLDDESERKRLGQQGRNRAWEKFRWCKSSQVFQEALITFSQQHNKRRGLWGIQ